MYSNLNKTELIAKCKVQGLRATNSNTKAELIALLESANSKPTTLNPTKSIYTNVLRQLLTVVSRDKVRKVCKQCHNLGHIVTSTTCPINIENNNKLLTKVKVYVLQQDCLLDKTAESYYQEISTKFNISVHQAKTLYNEITPDELLNRPLNVNDYLTRLSDNIVNCQVCNSALYNIQSNSIHKWKGNPICDVCWSSNDKAHERANLWALINTHKPDICSVCSKRKTYTEERYHYDHINMFYKGDSICNMVNEGLDFELIKCELDKCQIVCLQCHHLITDIEHKIGFIRIKQNLTRQLNTCELSVEAYEDLIRKYELVYIDKISAIYDSLREYRKKLASP